MSRPEVRLHSPILYVTAAMLLAHLVESRKAMRWTSYQASANWDEMRVNAF